MPRRNWFLVMMMLSGGCFASAPDTKSECNSDANCRSGFSCVASACVAQCGTQSQCDGSHACVDGHCLSKVAGTGPTIASVAGNAAGEPTKISDGFIVTGAELNTAAFELDKDGAALPLTAKSRTATSAEVVWSPSDLGTLPGVHAGDYQLMATTRSGSTLASVTLQLPDYSGDDLVSRINLATTPLADGVMPADVASLPAAFAALQARVAALEARAPIVSDMTITVPNNQNCDDIQAALNSLAGRGISPAATVTINVPDGHYMCSKSLTVPSLNGDRVRLIGNTLTQGQVWLQFADGVHGIVISSYSSSLGSMDGFTLTGAGKQASTNADGILVYGGGSVALGSKIEIANFKGSGIDAWVDGNVYAWGGVAVHDNGAIGIVAGNRSFVEIYDATSSNNGSDGFLAQNGGIMDIGYSTTGSLAKLNGGMGFRATRRATIFANRATADGNIQGFTADHSSYIDLTLCHANNNTELGYNAAFDSSIWAADSTATNNPASNYCSQASIINIASPHANCTQLN